MGGNVYYKKVCSKGGGRLLMRGGHLIEGRRYSGRYISSFYIIE